MAMYKKILTADGQRTDANSEGGFLLHPGHQCLELNMPQMLLPSLGFSCALGDDGVTGLYYKSVSLLTGSITLALKSHLTPHCFRQLDMVCSNVYHLLNELSVWSTASGVTPGPFPSIFSHGTGEGQIWGKNFLVTAYPNALPLLHTPSCIHGLTAWDGTCAFRVCIHMWFCLCVCMVVKVIVKNTLLKVWR